jgi:hypothetical protein
MSPIPVLYRSSRQLPVDSRQASTLQPSNTPFAIEVKLPGCGFGIKNADANLTCARPIAGDWKVIGMTKRAKAAVFDAIIQLSVAVKVQIPFAISGAEDTDTWTPCACPISDYRKISLVAVRPEALVHVAALKVAVVV